MQMARLPGVLAVEPYREVPVRIRNGNVERRVMISGRPRDADLSRIIDVDLRPVVLPEAAWQSRACSRRSSACGLAISSRSICSKGSGRTVTLPVAALVEDYFGIRA